MDNPKAFISYAWEDDIKIWVKNLAQKLRQEGVDAKLDQWEVVPGDQLTHFMETSIRANDFVIIICTPKYKEKSDQRVGGVGYEGDIMTAEVVANMNQRKFIPVLCSGDKLISIPSWLRGKFFIDLSSEHLFNVNFSDLVATLIKSREAAPPLGEIKNIPSTKPLGKFITVDKAETDPEIKIVGILADEVSQPSMDGSRGSALYKVPFQLNSVPSPSWRQLFIQAWNYPSSFTTMHRPGIASVQGKKIILDGTTIDEVARYHKDTLKLAVQAANTQYQEIITQRKRLEDEERKRIQDHQQSVEDAARNISFD